MRELALLSNHSTHMHSGNVQRPVCQSEPTAHPIRCLYLGRTNTYQCDVIGSVLPTQHACCVTNTVLTVSQEQATAADTKNCQTMFSLCLADQVRRSSRLDRPQPASVFVISSHVALQLSELSTRKELERHPMQYPCLHGQTQPLLRCKNGRNGHPHTGVERKCHAFSQRTAPRW